MEKNKKYLEFYLGCFGVLDIGNPPHITQLESGRCVLTPDVLNFIFKSDSATFKPNLRPLSDMLFSESDELLKVESRVMDSPYKPISDWAYKIDWLLKKRFDIFNLIPLGLALDSNK